MQKFSNIQEEIISRINETNESLKIAVTWFTNHDIFEAIIKKLENPDFKLELIVLNDRINNKKQGLDFQKLINLKAKFYFSDSLNMVHHKFCIFDNKTVITGSYNWTYYAENRNWENIVVINDSEMVNGFVQEFDKVINSHELVDNIESKKSDSISINFQDYIKTDYIYQAKTEEGKGNDINVARIYTELLKLEKKQPEIIQARNEIIKKYNFEQFEVAPFEIGILFKSGYIGLIPAYSELPFSITQNALTSVSMQKSIKITIQKSDILIKTIGSVTLEGIKPVPENTLKIENILTLEKNGILTVTCNELNGNGKTKTVNFDIKNWL